jgi:hypothetical protein
MNVFPASGTKRQSYDVAWRVSFSTPKVLLSRTRLVADRFRLADPHSHGRNLKLRRETRAYSFVRVLD